MLQILWSIQFFCFLDFWDEWKQNQLLVVFKIIKFEFINIQMGIINQVEVKFG